jgi:hypothetical protein
MWIEEAVAQFEILPRHLRRGAEKNHEKPIRIVFLLPKILTWDLQNTT